VATLKLVYSISLTLILIVARRAIFNRQISERQWRD